MTPIASILKSQLIPLPYCDVCGGSSCARNATGEILVCRNRRGPKAQTITTSRGVDMHLHHMGGDFDSYPMPLELPRPNGRA